jgi:polygalacturonase
LAFTGWEGTELMNYSPFIYAFEQENMAITGKGTVDGNCDCEHWWPWKGRTNCGWKPGDASREKDRNQLFDMTERGVPVSQRIFGEGHYLRPQFIQPYRCKNVLIEDVMLFNSPMWQVHPVLCTNVTVRGLTISSFGPNTDGCDPESCTDVLIDNYFFNTGDDCIAIKLGRNADGRRLGMPSQNIVIRNCRMKGGHGGVTLGSEIYGGVRNVFAENCQMDSPHLDVAVRIKNNAMRGGVIENIFARNIDVGEVAMAAFSVDFFYEEGESGKFFPVARNLEVRNLKMRKALYALYLPGFNRAPIESVRMVDCEFNGVSKPDVIENVAGLVLHNVKENGKLMDGAQT